MKSIPSKALLGLAVGALAGLAALVLYAPGRSAAARRQVQEKLADLEASLGGSRKHRAGERVPWGPYRCTTCGREIEVRVSGAPLPLCPTCQSEQFERP